MESGGKHKVENYEERSGKANWRMKSHLGKHFIPKQDPQKYVVIWALRSSIVAKSARRVKQDIRALGENGDNCNWTTIKKNGKKRSEDSTPKRSQDAMQETKAEVCWHKLCQRCGSKGKSPGMLEDWLQSRKTHPRLNSLVPSTLNVLSIKVHYESGLT